MSAVWVAAKKLGLGGGRGGDNSVGTGSGQLFDVFTQAGLDDVEEGEVSIAIDHASFDEWWEPFTHGVGPVGAFVEGPDDEQRAALVAELRDSVGDPPSGIHAVTWAARGRVPAPLK
jgi:hypothetical protein